MRRAPKLCMKIAQPEDIAFCGLAKQELPSIHLFAEGVFSIALPLGYIATHRLSRPLPAEVGYRAAEGKLRHDFLKGPGGEMPLPSGRAGR
jgi:hypothetical protein